MADDNTISTLNTLIETCKDGQEGFKQAAEGIQRSDVKSVFYELGQQRAKFAGELQSLVREMGDDPETTSSTAGIASRLDKHQIGNYRKGRRSDFERSGTRRRCRG